MTPPKKIEKNLVEKYLKTENLWKKELAAAARQRLPPSKKKINPEDASGSIRDISAHLIYDKKIRDTSTQYSFKIRIRWLRSRMDLLELIFSTPGTLDPEAGTDWTRMSKFQVPQVWPPWFYVAYQPQFDEQH